MKQALNIHYQNLSIVKALSGKNSWRIQLLSRCKAKIVIKTSTADVEKGEKLVWLFSVDSSAI